MLHKLNIFACACALAGIPIAIVNGNYLIAVLFILYAFSTGVDVATERHR